jgi:drug/metabolite transporter (DMT)-like permease
MQSRFAVPVSVLVITTCFAANSVITRYLVLGNAMSPFALTVIRFFSGFVMLQSMVVLAPGTFQRTGMRASYVWGAVFLASYAFAISYGYYFISAAAGVLIFYTFVILTMTGFSLVHDRERVTARLVLGQVLGIAGVVAITFSGMKSVTLTGALLMAVTGTSWGLYSVYGRRFPRPFGYTYNTFLIFGIATIPLSGLALLVSREAWFVNLSAPNLGWALGMGMLTTALSYALWNTVMQRIRASQGGVVQLLVPITAGLMGILFLGEEVTLSLVVGALLVLAGISLNTLRRSTHTGTGASNRDAVHSRQKE